MARTAGSIDLTTKDVTQGLTITVRIPRSFTLRTKVACWLIGLAGRVIDVPCEVEMREGSERRCDGPRGNVSPSHTTSPPPRKPIG